MGYGEWEREGGGRAAVYEGWEGIGKREIRDN